MTRRQQGGHTHSGASAAAVRPLDHLVEAARSGRYLTLQYAPSERTWSLRELDDATGELSGPIATSHPIGPSVVEAAAWAKTLPATGAVHGWHGRDVLDGETGLLIEESFQVVREIAAHGRPGHRQLVAAVIDDPQRPDAKLAVVRERWTASGALSGPVDQLPLDGHDTEVELLDILSKRLGADPTGWRQEGDLLVHD